MCSELIREECEQVFHLAEQFAGSQWGAATGLELSPHRIASFLIGWSKAGACFQRKTRTSQLGSHIPLWLQDWLLISNWRANITREQPLVPDSMRSNKPKHLAPLMYDKHPRATSHSAVNTHTETWHHPCIDSKPHCHCDIQSDTRLEPYQKNEDRLQHKGSSSAAAQQNSLRHHFPGHFSQATLEQLE